MEQKSRNPDGPAVGLYAAALAYLVDGFRLDLFGKFSFSGTTRQTFWSPENRLTVQEPLFDREPDASILDLLSEEERNLFRFVVVKTVTECTEYNAVMEETLYSVMEEKFILNPRRRNCIAIHPNGTISVDPNFPPDTFSVLKGSLEIERSTQQMRQTQSFDTSMQILPPDIAGRFPAWQAVAEPIAANTLNGYCLPLYEKKDDKFFQPIRATSTPAEVGAVRSHDGKVQIILVFDNYSFLQTFFPSGFRPWRQDGLYVSGADVWALLDRISGLEIRKSMALEIYQRPKRRAQVGSSALSNLSSHPLFERKLLKEVFDYTWLRIGQKQLKRLRDPGPDDDASDI